jgi:hypothetical protein
VLYVFLKNKLITADAAAPLIMELRARHPGQRVTFVVPSLKALQAIESNIVLHDALRQNGRIVQIGRRSAGAIGWIESKLRGLAWLFGMAVRSLSPRIIHMHFGAFERWPLKLLFHVAPKRSLLADSAFHGFTDRMVAFAQLKQDRADVVLPSHMSVGLAFHDKSYVRQSASNLGIPCFRMAAPHGLPSWQQWLERTAPRYLDELSREQPVLDQPFFITFVLGYFGPLDFFRDPEGGCLALFEEALDVVTKSVPDIPLVLKPHAVTDMDQLRRSLAKFPRAKTVVCNLHPAMLAARSYAVLSNYYSTTQSTAAEMGVPTIEYTEYGPRAYAATEGGSVRPDHITHFIQRDPERLRQVLQDLTKDRTQPVRFAAGQMSLDDRLFNFLATGQLPA